MSRRKQLKVDTFPFLAVLLCAMGSLILVLLVMDRRSKLAAQQRVSEQIRQQYADHERLTARQRADYEARKQARDAAWNKKRDSLQARISAEEQMLEAELLEVQQQLAEAARKLHEEEANVRKLRGQLKEEQRRSEEQKQELTEARRQAQSLTDKLAEADKTRERLAGELSQLEITLHTLKEARRRDSQAYSVVPYRGKLGENRRPIYVECNERGVIFHPDKHVIHAPSTEVLRQEVKKRMEKQIALGGPATRPYVLLLVRPDGIWRHYEMLNVASELRIGLGYEFVEPDWILHVPDEEVPSRPDLLADPGSSGFGGGGASGTTGGFVSRSGDNGFASSQQSGAANSSLGVGSGAHPSGSGSGSDLGSPIAFLPPPVTNPGTSEQGGSTEATSGTTVAMQSAVVRPNVGTSKEPELSPPSPPDEPSKEPSRPPVAASVGSAPGSSSGEQDTKFALPTHDEPKPLPLRPARISGSDDVTIFIECRSDVVMVYPARKQIGIDSLNHSAPHNPLTQTVKQIVAQQQARVRPGMAPARFHVRFLVHPTGERTYHLAYPALETISVPKTRYNLMADDSVARIIAEY